MKKVLVAALVAAVGLSLGSLGYKAWAIGPGTGTTGQTDVQALRSFQKETLPLRDEMAAKGLELREEYSKANPDQKRIAALQKEMIDLRAKIQDAAEKAGLADRDSRWAGRGGRGGGQSWGPGSMMGPGYGPGSMMGRGYGPGSMMGRGYGRGNGGGYNGYNCPMW